MITYSIIYLILYLWIFLKVRNFFLSFFVSYIKSTIVIILDQAWACLQLYVSPPRKDFRENESTL